VSAADLRLEYLAALRSTEVRDLAPLFGAGVPRSAIAITMPAIDHVTVDGALYRPDPDGAAAFVMPVRADDPLTPEALDPAEIIAEGPIVDLLAMHPRHPNRWALRTGAATWLGAVEPQRMGPDIVHIHRTPLDWLQADCTGLVLLSPDRRDRYRLLASLTAIAAADESHAVELRDLLSRPWAAPPVIVARREQRHAA